MAKEYYTDYVRRFYVEHSEGACITIENDDDGLGLVEVETKTAKDKDYFGDFHLSMSTDAMRGFAELLIEAANAIEKLYRDEE